MTRPPVSSAELQAAIAQVCAMSNDEFKRAAIAIGLIPERKAAVRHQRPARTAIVKVVADLNTFGVKCDWCGWATRKQQMTFHQAQLAAHNHNRHAHRDHCTVDARVA